MTDITDEDRELAANWNFECRRCSEYEGNLEADFAEAVSKYRLAAEARGEARGAERERARVVEWLRGQPCTMVHGSQTEWVAQSIEHLATVPARHADQGEGL